MARKFSHKAAPPESSPRNNELADKNIAKTLHALGHEMRLKAVFHIAEKTDNTASAGELCRYLKIPHNKLNFHTGKLLSVGLIKKTRKGREIFFSLNVVMMDAVLRRLMQRSLQVSDIKYRAARQATSQTQLKNS